MSDKSKTIKVSKIDIEIDGKTISLSPAEAKELKDILNETFPDNLKYVPYLPITIPYPIYIERPYNPWPLWDNPVWYADKVTFTCKNLTETTC